MSHRIPIFPPMMVRSAAFNSRLCIGSRARIRNRYSWNDAVKPSTVAEMVSVTEAMLLTARDNNICKSEEYISDKYPAFKTLWNGGHLLIRGRKVASWKPPCSASITMVCIYLMPD